MAMYKCGLPKRISDRGGLGSYHWYISYILDKFPEFECSLSLFGPSRVLTNLTHLLVMKSKFRSSSLVNSNNSSFLLFRACTLWDRAACF